MFCIFATNFFGQIFQLLLRKKSLLTTMLVDVMYQFLFCFCFWFPPFIVFNTELVYNENHYVVLPFLPRTNWNGSMAGGYLLVTSLLSLVFWTIKRLVIPKVWESGRQRSEVQTLLLQRCALRKFSLTDGQNKPDQSTRGRSEEIVFVHSIHSLW